MASRIQGLYVITPDWDDSARLLDAVAAALAGGAAVVQYRNKRAAPDLRLQQASQLASLCRNRGVPLIINDHPDLMLAVDADGLHAGAEDGDLHALRQRLGPGRLLGASCYNRIALAQAAVAAADHIAFGAVFPSGVKPQAVRAPLALFGQAAELGVPRVAIGGITLAHVPALIQAGADALAVISAIFSAADIEGVTRQFVSAIQSARSSNTPQDSPTRMAAPSRPAGFH